MIKVITPISHDGIEYLEGETLSAGADQEKALVELGSAEYVEADVEDVETGLIVKTKKELEAIATELGVVGVKKMNKTELISAIEEAQSAPEAPVEEEEVEDPAEDSADVEDVE